MRKRAYFKTPRLAYDFGKLLVERGDVLSVSYRRMYNRLLETTGIQVSWHHMG